MDVPNFIKNTSGSVLLMQQHSKKIGESKPSSMLTMKTKWLSVVAAVMIFEVAKNWRSVLQILWKKVRL